MDGKEVTKNASCLLREPPSILDDSGFGRRNAFNLFLPFHPPHYFFIFCPTTIDCATCPKKLQIGKTRRIFLSRSQLSLFWLCFDCNTNNILLSLSVGSTRAKGINNYDGSSISHNLFTPYLFC